jgi:hypothetical protein
VDVPRTIEEPILLEYRLPAWKQAFLYLLMGLIVVPFVVLSLEASNAYRTAIPAAYLLAIAVLVLAITIWFLRQLFRTVVAFTCAGAGIGITTPSGIRRSVPWTGVRRLRRLGLGFVWMATDAGGFLMFPLPDRVVRGLLAILRESSDAVISGFESE